jgi:ABC-2 type transport system permease protein
MTAISPLATTAPTLAGGGWAHEVRAAWIVMKRDLIRMFIDRGRMISTLLQPVLLLFVLGAGLSTLVNRGGNGANFKTFLFPGVIVTGILFTAVFSAISIVWDREFGFLREMMVAPISGSSIVVGKCLAGALIPTLQSVVLVLLGGTVGVPYRVGLIFGVLGVVFVTSFAMTAFGLVLAARVKSVQTLMPIIQMILMPLTFLSGSLYPLGSSVPTWLDIVSRFNPLTYAVTSARAVVFHYLPSDSPTRKLVSPLTWNGWVVQPWLQVIVIAGIGAVLLTIACALFSRTE